MPAVTVSDITVLPRISATPGAQPRAVKEAPKREDGRLLSQARDGSPVA